MRLSCKVWQCRPLQVPATPRGVWESVAIVHDRRAAHGAGPGDVGDAMEEDDSDGGVFSMDAAADVLEEFSEQLNANELFTALPPDVFAAAHTGDCQAVRAFLADPRGNVNMRDRHATVLARTLLSTSWADPPVHPNPNPLGPAA